MIELNELKSCTLCPRACGANRLAGEVGYCGAGPTLRVARAALHKWEEPCISGAGLLKEETGSGAVFFCHCNLGCTFCQNKEISKPGGDMSGFEITTEQLANIFSDLQEKGATNINLVTGVHFLPQISRAIEIAHPSIPVAYNSGGYESAETIRKMEDQIDIYMPDMKYMDSELAGSLSMANDYPTRAKEAIGEMVRQKPVCKSDENGLMLEGVLVRHMILPGHTKDSISILNYLADTYGDNIYISLLRQYTPMPGAVGAPDRKLTDREYDKVVDAAIKLGLSNVYIQEKTSARAEFIPKWNGEGVLRNHNNN